MAVIRGRIRRGPEALVPITLHGASNRRKRVEAVPDTGFTGHLCLARRFARGIRVIRVGTQETELADGSTIEQ